MHERVVRVAALLAEAMADRNHRGRATALFAQACQEAGVAEDVVLETVQHAAWLAGQPEPVCQTGAALAAQRAAGGFNRDELWEIVSPQEWQRFLDPNRPGGEPDPEFPYDAMPPLDTDGQKALKISIAEVGMTDPVLVDEHGTVIHGHQRVRAWRALFPDRPDGYPKVEIATHGLTDDAKRSKNRAANATNRQLTPAMMRALIDAELTARPECSDRAIAETLGSNQPRVGRRRKVLYDAGLIDEPGYRIARNGSRRTTRVPERRVPPEQVVYAPPDWADGLGPEARMDDDGAGQAHQLAPQAEGGGAVEPPADAGPEAWLIRDSAALHAEARLRAETPFSDLTLYDTAYAVTAHRVTLRLEDRAILFTVKMTPRPDEPAEQDEAPHLDAGEVVAEVQYDEASAIWGVD